jgi:HSP20 family protein
MDQVMQRMVGENLGVDGSNLLAALTPLLDIEEVEKEYTIKADLPGVAPQDVDISVAENTLILRGHAESVREEKKDYHRIERFEGQFYREIALPQGIDTDQIDASSEHGVLTIRLPKKAETHPKKINVRAKEHGAQPVQERGGKEAKSSHAAQAQGQGASSQASSQSHKQSSANK